MQEGEEKITGVKGRYDMKPNNYYYYYDYYDYWLLSKNDITKNTKIQKQKNIYYLI